MSKLTVVAAPLDGGAETRAALPDHATTVSVSIANDAQVSLHAIADGCWSETIERAAEESDVTLRVYTAAKARGTLEADHGRWPAKIEAAVFRTPDAGEHAISISETGHPLDCRFEQPAWQCVVPADTPVDLRLSAKGFAQIYYWGVVARDELTLEPRPLRAGGSVSGWIENPAGKPIDGAQVVLTPASHARNEDARVTAREAKVRTDRRGFFQLTGLGEGEYRLISRADGFSPAVLPVVNLRESESLVWPRTIVHAPFAELEVLLTPATDSSGKPWIVSMEEVTPLEATSRPLRRAADAQGQWHARALRADVYRVNIEDADGAVVERFVADLSKSGTTRIPVNVSRKVVQGVLSVGDEPLEAEIHFGNLTGRTVRTKSDDLGHFKASFPKAGKWTPTIFPTGPDGARITADEIVVPDTDEDHAIDIVLAGGRIRGAVVANDGRKVRAAVHVSRDQKLIAQQVTDKEGTFDFLGIEEGDYTVDAEGDSGSARKQGAAVAEGETVDLTLRLAPYRHVSAIVFTANHAPASGAIVRFSTDGGLSWSDLFASVDGSFEYDLSEGENTLIAIVLTHAYPALLTQLAPSDGPVPIVLPALGGMLRTSAHSYVSKAGALAPLKMFFVPPSPNGLYDGAAYLEPGVYTVCAGLVVDSRCRSVTINPGSEITLNVPRNEEETR